MASEVSRAVESLLGRLLAEANLPPLTPDQTDRFEAYLSLFVRWNGRTNLSAVREPDAIRSRHFVESIACAHALPDGISSLLDFGSGGGLPGIPIALCRPEVMVTLAESQGKKAAFLQEAVRTLGLSSKVFNGRAETLEERFDCVTLRAVDKMAEAVHEASRLLFPGGWLALMTTNADVSNLSQSAGQGFSWDLKPLLPGSAELVLLLGRRL
jgi:16S rRNA (guanine527-N7)-methyltransferase